MSEVDVARLKRLRAAIASTLSSVQEKSARGLPPTCVALRRQVLEAVPDGLRNEAEAIAPDMSLPTGGRGFGTGFDPIESSNNGAEAHARLAALKGWLDGLITDSES